MTVAFVDERGHLSFQFRHTTGIQLALQGKDDDLSVVRRSRVLRDFERRYCRLRFRSSTALSDAFEDLAFAIVRHKSNESRSLDSYFDQSLVLCTVAGAVSGEELSLLRRQLLQRGNILVIDVVDLFTAKPTDTRSKLEA